MPDATRMRSQTCNDIEPHALSQAAADGLAVRLDPLAEATTMPALISMSLSSATVEVNKPEIPTSISTHTQNAVVLCLLILFVLLNISSSARLTSTMDEPLFYQYGLNLTYGDATRISDSSKPFLALNALPSRIASVLPDGLAKIVLSRFFVARLITIIFSTLLAYLVFRWSYSLNGYIPALFSVVLYILDPNIIAHSQLVTTDLYATGMITLSFYWIWRFSKSRRLRDGLMCALVLGVSQLAKYTAVVLLPLCLLALVLHDGQSLKEGLRKGGVRTLSQYAMKILLYVTVVLVLNVLIINAGFLFNRTFTRFKDYRFRSEFFQSIQADLPWLGQVPIPLPYPYIEGLDWVRQNEQSAASYGNIYLLGHLSKPKGFPGYYFVAGLLKIPVASQIIILASLTLLFINRKHRKTLLQDGVFFLVPAAFFTIFYNFFYDTPIGIRHYLVMFPLLYVFARSLFNNWINWPRFWKGSSLILIAYLGVSVLSYFPYYIPYFNELVWNKTRRTNTCLTRILSGGKARMI